MPNTQFTEIFNTYQKPIYNYVLRMVRNNEIAEELTQEVFIKAYKKLSTFRGDSKLYTWIYQIATNTCLDYLRKANSVKSNLTVSVEQDNIPDESRDDNFINLLSLDKDLIKTEMCDCIRDYIEGLSDDYRTVIILHDLEGLKNREIADILDCSLETVKIRLHRARNKLKAILTSNCDFYLDDNGVLCCDRKRCDGDCESK